MKRVLTDRDPLVVELVTTGARRDRSAQLIAASHFLVGLAISMLVGCDAPKTSFQCTGNAGCRDGEIAGFCEENGFCSFEDPDCPEGRRFGTAADAVGDQCVDSGPSPVGSFKKTAELPQHRYSLAVAADATTIYAIGGIEGSTPYPDVSIATIAGGSLTTWASGTALPAPRRSFGAAVGDGFVYAIGGRTEPGTSFSSDVLAAKIESGGVGDWLPTTSLPAGLKCHAVAQSGNTVYVLGGKAGSNSGVTDVAIGAMSNGTVTWRTGSAMTTPRFCHSATVANGYLYAIGGCQGGNNGCNTPLLDTVEFAKILDDGSLGPFQPTTSLPEGHWHHTSAGNAHYLMIAGGHIPGQDNITKVLATHINPDGSLGVWRDSPPLASGGARQSAVVVSDQVFVIATAVQTATLKP